MRYYRLLIVLVLWNCSESEFVTPRDIIHEVIDNKVAITGGYCTENAENLESYLKIMFIVDRSNSLRVTDKYNKRVEATWDLFYQFVDDPNSLKLRSGVEIAVVSFWGTAAVHTRNKLGLMGFSAEGPKILSGLLRLADVGSNTSYTTALSTAYQILDIDMANMGEVAKKTSRYEVFFLSDGFPDPEHCRGESNSLRTAISTTKRIKNLETAHGVPLTFHTAFASHPGMFTEPLSEEVVECLDVVLKPFSLISDSSQAISGGQITRKLLQLMAEAGGGTFIQFANDDDINFLDFKFSESRRLYGLYYFIAANRSSKAAYDHVEPDSDNDGLIDLIETNLGTSPFLLDSDNDGFGDGIEYRFRISGYDPLDPTDAQCEERDRIDTDGDFLLDCEEKFLGTHLRSFDTDRDGAPDITEIQAFADAQSNTPLLDHHLDSDSDGSTNIEEIKWHTDPQIDDVAELSEIAYDYYQRQLPIEQGTVCYEFRVSNISLAKTKGPSAFFTEDDQDGPNGWNRIMLYMAQTPYDDIEADPLYRMACVDARFLEEWDITVPANGRIDLPLRRPADTYDVSPILQPNQTKCHASVNQDCGLGSKWCRMADDGSSCTCWDPPPVIYCNATDSFCPAGRTCNIQLNACSANAGEENGINPQPCPECADGIDNDGDGLTDYPFDPDCFDSVIDNEASDDECSDGIDNDGDGLTDYPFDPGCPDGVNPSARESDSLPNTPECSDGIDNAPGNLLVDFDGGRAAGVSADMWTMPDPGCYAASDMQESLSTVAPCKDLLDNDGDGLVDLNDPGCMHSDDISEDGPGVCFYCQEESENLMNQCDMSYGFCKARARVPCSSDDECRGSRCTNGLCQRCLEDKECDSTVGAGDGICDASRGWCLKSYSDIQHCTSDTDCSGAPCDPDMSYCQVDPYFACRSDIDCKPGAFCQKKRGVCMERVFSTSQCSETKPCVNGICDEESGWCVPNQEEGLCHHDDQCPQGNCVTGHCDQQTFMFPKDFHAEIDCLREQ